MFFLIASEVVSVLVLLYIFEINTFDFLKMVNELKSEIFTLLFDHTQNKNKKVFKR